MAKTNKSTNPKPIADVQKPDDVVESTTSKPVIITNRPLIKDPMVVEEVEDKQVDNKKPLTTAKSSTKAKIEPLTPSVSTESDSETEKTSDIDAEAKADNEPIESKSVEKDTVEPAPVEADKSNNKKADPTGNEQALEDRRAEEHDANLQKIVNAKTYYLPINAVEKRKTKRFLILGVCLSVLLIFVWLNIALDAELIQVNGISPLTHFF